MIDGKDAKFRNIVLQDNDGILTTIEPTEGVHVILMVAREKTSEIFILSHASVPVTAQLIHKAIKETPSLGPTLMAESLADLFAHIKADVEEGGPPHGPLQ